MRGDVIFVLLLALLEEALSMMHPPQCPNLVLKNGKVKRRQRGRFVKFVCNTGYMLAGEKFSTCSFGEWDPQPPKCVRPTCVNNPKPPANGLIYPTHNRAALHIYCKHGYQLKGPSDIYCDGRKWDNNMPACLATNTKPKLYCDFEDEDICGWTHDLNHDFDWKRENYNTPSGSIGTGPSFDHTKGTGKDGYYMYIESSSRNENDTAKFISPIFDKTNSSTCLEFFYHMYGATTGSLRVYLKKISEDWSLDRNTPIFSKSGNQGNKWYRSYHYLGVIEEEYQIVIEGIRGNGYVSDIAIDDVRIVQDCVYEEETTTMEMVYSTEMLLSVEACENRCGQKAFANETHQITCDCDDSCYDNNRCCPDYFDFCLSDSTSDDYLTTTDMPNELFVASTIPPVVATTAPTTTTSTSTTRPTTALKITSTITKKPSPTTTTTTKPSQSTTKRPTTTSTTKKPTTKTTTIKTITRKIVPVTRPTIRLLTQPTQPIVFKKTVTYTPKKSTTQIIKPKKVDKETSNDVIEVPRPTESDEELIVTPKDNSLSKEVDDPLDSARFLDNFSEKDKIYSVKEKSPVNYNVVLVVISLLGITVLISVIVVFMVRRYRCNHRRMASANGDSQSDVRFLTSDEVLDFSLDKDYDSL